MSGEITRAALGEVVSLGHLYDARTDTFCSFSMFSKKIPESAVTRTDSHHSDIHVMHSDDYLEKFKKFEVEAELQASVLAGLCTLSGYGKFLKERTSSARTMKSSLIYKIQTRYEHLNIHHENLRDAILTDVIEKGLATHVVVGISWGATTILSCEAHILDGHNAKEIKGSFLAKVKYLELSIGGQATADVARAGHTNEANFDIRILGDVVLDQQKLATTFEDALELISQMPTLVAKCNEGKGKPLMYKLCPLHLLKDRFKFNIKADTMIQTLEENSLLGVVQLCDEMTQVRQKIYDYHQDAEKLDFCILQADLAKIRKLKTKVDSGEAQFRSQLAAILVDVRSGKAEVSKIENLLAEWRSGEMSPEELRNSLGQLSYITGNMTFAEFLIQNGVCYIGNGASFDEEVLKSFTVQSFVLFFKEDAKTKERESWDSNWQTFLQEVTKGQGSKYYVVNCDIHPELWPPSGTSIQLRQNGVVVTEDLVSYRKKAAALPVAQSRVDVEMVLRRPNKRTKLAIRCPGKRCCPSPTHDWICPRCGDFWEYGFDDYVYCFCGRTLPCHLEFRCPHAGHGTAYETFQGPFLQELLDQLRLFKEKNILLLGETGVGKSTWINSLVNFLMYDSLEEAKDKELHSLIPTRFILHDDDLQEIVVSTGTDDNEVHITGQSSTQQCRVYTFPIGDTLYRLIDTPGIGDTRGIEQDEKNFENILSTLCYLEELHGICILLKPNNAKLTVMFRFCIKELLTHLHRDASQNIMFCFTNCRGTLYQPGDTLPALRKLLEENQEPIELGKATVYSFDSEAFRFLTAIKNKAHPVTYSDDDQANFARSWDKSKTETRRMKQHIDTLRAHCIKSTLNVNYVRQLVLQLIHPLADISKTIHSNRTMLEEQLTDIQRTKANIEELQKRQCPKKELTIVKLPYPRLVCTNPDCWIAGSMIGYNRVCHLRCGMRGVTSHTVGDPRFLFCKVIRFGYCRHLQCRHSYKDHMLKCYASMEVTKPAVDATAKKLLKDKSYAIKMKQIMIDETRTRINEYEEELKQIREKSVQFARFLKENAITPYNDAMLEYLDYQIRGEQIKEELKNKVLKFEEMFRETDKKLINNLSDAKSPGSETDKLKPEEVHEMVIQLYRLKHNGKTLKNMIDALNSARKQIAQYQEVPLRHETHDL